MRSKLGHIYLYVSDLEESYSFYKPLLEFLGYKQILKKDWFFSFINDGLSIWFEKARSGHVDKGYHRKRIGLNHLAFRVSSRKKVDEFSGNFLRRYNIPTLYNSPKDLPEYEEGYYAVYFEDPDRIKLEVAYYP